MTEHKLHILRAPVFDLLRERIRTYESGRNPREKDACILFQGDALESERSEEGEERLDPAMAGVGHAPLAQNGLTLAPWRRYAD